MPPLYQQPAEAFSCEDGLNRRLLDALIFIGSPVCGLRPIRAPRLVTRKVPKVPIWYLPPFLQALSPSSMVPNTSSMARLASALVTLPSRATASTKSALLNALSPPATLRRVTHEDGRATQKLDVRIANHSAGAARGRRSG